MLTRYRVNVPFGPWARGEEFESADPLHAALAEQGRVLEVADAASAGRRAGREEVGDGESDVRAQGL